MGPETLQQLMVRDLPYLFVGSFVWVALSGAVIYQIRKRRGLPTGKPEHPNTLFTETWTSTRMANNCAWVILTRDFLEVGLHFPFCVSFPVFLSKMMGLDLMVPLEQITHLELTSQLWRRGIAVTWRDEEGPHTASVCARGIETLFEKLHAAAAAKGAAVAR